MRLIHYSRRPVVFQRSWVYINRAPGKPFGFWVTPDRETGPDDILWPEWRRSEMGEEPGDAYEVIFRESANVLLVDTLAGLESLHSRLRRTPGASQGMPEMDPSWAAVRARWDGVVIAPYRWERRLDFLWYYGWDCASGVIWNLDAIDSVVRVPTALPLSE